MNVALKHPSKLRLVAEMPVSFSLSDYEPFVPVGRSGFGLSVVEDVSDKAYDKIRRIFRKAFGDGATVGFAPATSVQAIFFDMDATVIRQESLVEMAEIFGCGAMVQQITERAMRGELSFKESLVERVALLKGAPQTIVDQVASRLTLCPGIQPLIAFCREVKVPTFMISGGFTVLAESVQRKVGFTGFHANSLGISDGKLTGLVEGEIVDALGKKDYVIRTCSHLGIDPEKIAVVGDGANDLEMMSVAGVAVGFQPKPILLDHIHALNAVGNHSFLGPLLFGRDLTTKRSPHQRGGISP